MGVTDCNVYVVSVLALPDPKYVGSALPANTLGRWPLVLHGDLLGTLDFNLLTALHAIRSHSDTSLTVTDI